MNKILIILFFTFYCSYSIAQETTVFKAGEDGYASYRIPAIVKMKNGDLIAFAEGRVEHAGDFGNVDIVCKISSDNGKTWGTLDVLVDYDRLQAGNPAPVVDLLDPAFPNGRLFLYYNTGNDHESTVRKGKGLREVWYITSIDGISWSEPVNITTQVHRPNQPNINPAYNFKEDWRTYANTPGHALQLIAGPNKGRILVAANHNAGDPLPQNKDWNAHAYYSDDHGKTFQLSENVPFPGSNESMAAQIGDDKIFMTSRNQQLNPKQRIISISSDGGKTWDTSYSDPSLPDPINQASVLSWKKGNRFMLAHLNTAHESRRDHLTLRISKDQGKTWYYNQVIAKSPNDDQNAYAAYSDLVLVSKNRMGILFEKYNYQEIVFTVVKF